MSGVACEGQSLLGLYRRWPSDPFWPRSTIVPVLKYINTWLILYLKVIYII